LRLFYQQICLKTPLILNVLKTIVYENEVAVEFYEQSFDITGLKYKMIVFLKKTTKDLNIKIVDFFYKL